jgi:hypothetical protein
MRTLVSHSARLALIAALSSIHGDVTAQSKSVPKDTVITLERTACFGTCPVYLVNVDAKGNVIYEGKQFVRMQGRQTARIPSAQVAAILRTAERVGFFDLRDKYVAIENPDGTVTHVTDLPTTYVKITSGGRSKRVEDYIGAPPGLRELEREIDSATRSKRWVFIDEQELAEIVRDHGKPPPEDLTDLLAKAVETDDPGVLKALLALDADPNVKLFDNNTTLLMVVRSTEAARLLIDAGAKADARNDLGMTPMRQAAGLDAGVVRLLLSAGARADVLVDETGGTTLWYAACAGNAGVVSALLAAGANPAVTSVGQSALECAKTRRDAARTAPRLNPELDSPLPYAVDYDAVIKALEATCRSGRC